MDVTRPACPSPCDEDDHPLPARQPPLPNPPENYRQHPVATPLLPTHAHPSLSEDTVDSVSNDAMRDADNLPYVDDGCDVVEASSIGEVRKLLGVSVARGISAEEIGRPRDVVTNFNVSSMNGDFIEHCDVADDVEAQGGVGDFNEQYNCDGDRDVRNKNNDSEERHDDSEDNCDVSNKMNDVRKTRDVDSGWAWVVLVASCVSIALQEVMFTASGMFMVEFQASFEGSRGYLSVIGSLFFTSTGMLGPVAGVLTTLLTPRVTVMLGAACLSLALEAASFAASRQTLLLTYGIIAGFGNSLLYTAAITAFSAYFVRYRQAANGLLQASTGVGSLVGPYVIRWLTREQGWRFGLATYTLLLAQICVLGALIYPQPGQISALSHPFKLCRKALWRCCMGTRRQGTPEKARRSDGAGVINDPGKALLGGQTSAETSLPANGASLWSRVQRVVSRREMWLVAVNQMMVMMVLSLHYIHLPSYMADNHIDLAVFPNLNLAFGLSQVTVRVVGGLVLSRFGAHLELGMAGCELTAALTMGLMPLYGRTESALYVYNIMLGLSWSPCFMLATPVLINYLGVDSLPIAFGTMLMACGTGSFLTATLAGYMYDALGTYDVSFHFGGCCLTVAAIIILILPCMGRKRQWQRKKSLIVTA